MGGCVEASVFIAPQAVPRLELLLQVRSRSVRSVRGYAAIDFDDGFDSYFVRVEVGGETGEAKLAQLVEEFERVNTTRRQVIMALRHLATENNTALEMSRCGTWRTQSGCATSSIDVGARLTRRAKENPPTDALVSFLEHGWLPKVTEEQTAILVAREQAPVSEVKWKEDGEAGTLFGPGILSLDCEAMEDPDFEPASAAEVLDKLAPNRNSPGQQVLSAVVQRVGSHRFSAELLGKGGAHLDFTDRQDHFRIYPQGARMAKFIKELGPTGAIEHLVREFETLDKARTEALALVQTVMAKQGFYFDDAGWYFGRTEREVQFPTRRGLTLKLRKRDSCEVVRDWLAEHRPFEPVPSRAAIKNLGTQERETPKRRSLPGPGVLKNSERLSPLDSFDATETDRLAMEIISETKQLMEEMPLHGRLFGDRDPLDYWTEPKYYRRGKDTWANEEWWLGLAGKAWNQGKNEAAALILMANGRDQPRAELLREMAEREGWDPEAFDERLMWPLLTELPWPIDDYGEYPKFPAGLGSPPPQPARRAAMQCCEVLAEAEKATDDWTRWQNQILALDYAAKLDAISAAEWMSKGELGQLRVAGMQWAEEPFDLMALRHESPLDVAARFGWPEVVDKLQKNRAFIAAHFEFENTFFDPGQIALRLSQGTPNELAARFAGLAINGNFAANIAQRANTISGTMNEKIQKTMREILEQQWKLGRFAAAIAWTRCRSEIADRWNPKRSA